jgi:hypothetical protein
MTNPCGQGQALAEANNKRHAALQLLAQARQVSNQKKKWKKKRSRNHCVLRGNRANATAANMTSNRCAHELGTIHRALKLNEIK